MRGRTLVLAAARPGGGSWPGLRQGPQHRAGRVNMLDRYAGEGPLLQVVHGVADEVRLPSTVRRQFNEDDAAIARPSPAGDEAAALQTVKYPGHGCGSRPDRGPQLRDGSSDAIGEVAERVYLGRSHVEISQLLGQVGQSRVDGALQLQYYGSGLHGSVLYDFVGSKRKRSFVGSARSRPRLASVCRCPPLVD